MPYCTWSTQAAGSSKAGLAHNQPSTSAVDAHGATYYLQHFKYKHPAPLPATSSTSKGAALACCPCPALLLPLCVSLALLGLLRHLLRLLEVLHHVEEGREQREHEVEVDHLGQEPGGRGGAGEGGG